MTSVSAHSSNTCVVLTFCHCFFIWPFMVASDSQKYLLMARTVSPGQVMYFPACIALVQVSLVGKPDAV